MGTDKNFADFILDQLEALDEVRYTKMFGEYALYCKDKVVALICNNQLFIKPTEKGKKYIGNVKEAPAYPGAKLSYLIEEQIEDAEWLSKLIEITFKELPEPKPKKKKV